MIVLTELAFLSQLADLGNMLMPWAVDPRDALGNDSFPMRGFRNNPDIPVSLSELEDEQIGSWQRDLDWTILFDHLDGSGTDLGENHETIPWRSLETRV